MDKEWTKHPRFSREYIEGVKSFLDIAYSRGRPQGLEILCPCASCKNCCWARRNVVLDHLITSGFLRGYNVWVHHGEEIPSPPSISKRNAMNRIKQKYMHHTRPSAEKVDGEKVTRAEIFIKTQQGRKRKEVDEETLDDAISKLQSSAEQAFEPLFGKEKSGRGSCYGRTMTPTILKKNQEIEAILKRHAIEMNGMAKKIQRLEAMMKFLFKLQNPELDENDIEEMMARVI